MERTANRLFSPYEIEESVGAFDRNSEVEIPHIPNNYA